MKPAEMRPSDVVLLAPCLVGTMGRAEREFAAALIVRACQRNGDLWKAVGPKEIGETLKADVDAERQPLAAMSRLPFCRPDFRDLAKEGFARFDGDPEKGAPVELTLKALRAIRRRWYCPSDKPCPKCATPSRCVQFMQDEDYIQRLPPDSPEAIFGADKIRIGGFEFREIYECSVHEEFAFKEDGTAYFVFPEMWVAGPNGERLFAT